MIFTYGRGNYENDIPDKIKSYNWCITKRFEDSICFLSTLKNRKELVDQTISIIEQELLKISFLELVKNFQKWKQDFVGKTDNLFDHSEQNLSAHL